MMKAFKEGFTLVELSLSMAFIGVLSVAIVLIISNTISSYQRGLTLNQINTTGMDLIDDMRTAVQNSSSKSVLNDCYRYYGNNGVDFQNINRAKCVESDGKGFVAYTKKANVTLYKGDGARETVLSDIPIYGVFCTGSYSYIWNSGYFNEVLSGAVDYASFQQKTDKSWAKFSYINASNRRITIVGALDGYYDKTTGELMVGDDGTVGDPDKPFRLLKIPDKERAVCASVVRNADNDYGYELPNNDALPSMFSVDAKYGALANEEEPVDLILEDTNNDLALYSLEVAPPAESATRKNAFYAVSFILGTIRGGVNIKAQGKNCEVPMDYEVEEFDYCAINKFSFAVQAGGE
ncbi:hypothetical protein IJJ37_00295 [Candidatus Saccharibacteria bacterium]|nr:hypothetical protein [Candidatus Saccharibacteria bacterium]